MPNWDVLILGGDVVTPDGVHRLDIAIEAGAIAELAAELPGDARETIDATGLHVFPGLIDPHVHFNEPGRTDWEGFATGSSALAAGGGTCFFDMPLNSSPPTLDGRSFDLKRAAAEASSRTDFGLWGGLTPGSLDRMEELAERGVVGFKAFMCNSGIEDFQHSDDETLYRGMEIAAKLDLVVAVHAESEEITSRLTGEARAAGGTTYLDYVRSRPVEAELTAIRTAVAMAIETGCSLHIVHVSSPEGALECADAFNNHDITRETCPHYFFFTENDLFATGAPLKCAPPLRDQTSARRIRDYLDVGLLDFVTSDHSPAPASMKTSEDAFAVWGGIAGVQATLPVMLTTRKAESPFRIIMIARQTATMAAHRFRIPDKGQIALGFDADLTLIDLAAQYVFTRDMLLDRHKLSPYVGRTFHGLVKRTLARGRTIFADGKMVGDDDHRGRLIKPARKA
jgi:allantoinase